MSNVKDIQKEILEEALFDQLRGLVEQIDEIHTDLCDASNERNEIGIVQNCTKNRRLIRKMKRLLSTG